MYSLLPTRMRAELACKQASATFLPINKLRKAALTQVRLHRSPKKVVKVMSTGDFWIGANIPWYKYGDDCGRFLPNHNKGVSSEWYETAFQKLSAAKANTARFWLFADGRSHPFFQSILVDSPTQTDRNTVIKYPGSQDPSDPASQNAFDNEFWDDFAHLLDRADHYGIGLIPVLWDFHAMDDPDKSMSKSQCGHKELFNNPDLVTKFINLALIPLVSRFKDHPGLKAWDIINEPEWAIDSTFNDTHRLQLVPGPNLVSKSRMQEFVARCAAAIHTYGGSKPVTVGNSLQFSWPFDGPLPDKATQYWTDGSLRTAYKRFDLTWNPSPTDKSNYDLPTLDFYQCHLYTDFEDRFNPCRMTGWDSMISHKPILIGEVQVSDHNYKKVFPNTVWDKHKEAKERRDAALQRKYLGILYWSYGGHTVTGVKDEDTGEMADFAEVLDITK